MAVNQIRQERAAARSYIPVFSLIYLPTRNRRSLYSVFACMVYKEQKQYRLPGYNYGDAGIYFVTICVKDRLPVLSFVGTPRGAFLPDPNALLPDFDYNPHAISPHPDADQEPFELILSPIGEIIRHFWQAIPDRFPGVGLDEWVIMPDHVHGLIQLGNGLEPRGLLTLLGDNVPSGQNVPRRGFTEIEPTSGIQPLKPSSLSSIINHFKGNVKRWCNQNGYEEFVWQPRFYEHIVRHDQDLTRIREYIRQNPARYLKKDL